MKKYIIYSIVALIYLSNGLGNQSLAHKAGSVVRQNYDQTQNRKYYFPTANPSKNRINPGEYFGYSGFGFAANENVVVMDENNNEVIRIKADNWGRFNSGEIIRAESNKKGMIRHKIYGDISNAPVFYLVYLNRID